MRSATRIETPLGSTLKLRRVRTLVCVLAATFVLLATSVWAQNVPVWGRFEAVFTSVHDYDNPHVRRPALAIVAASSRNNLQGDNWRTVRFDRS